MWVIRIAYHEKFFFPLNLAVVGSFEPLMARATVDGYSMVPGQQMNSPEGSHNWWQQVVDYAEGSMGEAVQGQRLWNGQYLSIYME